MTVLILFLDIYEELGLGAYISRLDANTNQPLDDDKRKFKSIVQKYFPNLAIYKLPPELPVQNEPQPQVKHVPVEPPKPSRPKSVVISSAAPIPQPVVIPPQVSTPAPHPMNYAKAVR
jgi:hypothetical protein